MRPTGVATFVLALITAGRLFAWSAPERVDRKPDGYILPGVQNSLHYRAA